MKRLIALIISALLLIGMLPGISMAQDDLPQKDELYENSKKLVTAINRNFDFGNMSKDTAISRGDFIRLAVGLYSVIPSTTKHSFTDVSEDLAPFINFALENGMIDSGDKFYPQNPINYDLAVKIAVIMTGYTPYALSGGYHVAANNAGFLKGLNGNNINVRNAVVLLANVLNTKIMQQTSFGSDELNYEISPKTFLEMYHSIVSCEGVVNANMYTSLTSADAAASNGNVIIGFEEFASLESQYLGYNVRAYYDKTTKKVVTMYPLDNRQITCDEIMSLNGNTVEYINSKNNVSRLNLDKTYQFIYNGRAYMHSDYETLIKFDEGTAEFIDNNNDGRYDVVFVWDYNYMHVNYVDLYEGRIFDINNDYVIDLSDSDCKYEVYHKFLFATEKAELSDIGENSIITYCISKDKKYCRIYISEENIAGKISEINEEYKYVKIGDDIYNYNSYFERYYLNYVGQNATFNLSYDGKLVSVGNVTDSAYTYGWLSDVDMSNNRMNPALYLRIYTQNGKLTDFKTAENIIFDGTKKSKDQAYSLLQTYCLGSVYDRVIKYGINDDGLISLIDTSVTATHVSQVSQMKELNNSLTKYYEGTYRYRKTPGTFGGEFRVSDSSVIFTIPYDEASRNIEKNYTASVHSKTFTDDKNYTVSAYDIDKTGLANCVVYTASESSDAKAELSNSAVLAKTRIVYFPEDGEIKKVYDVYISGKYVSCTSYDDGVETVMSSASVGDVLRLSINSRNEIVGAILDYDLSEKTVVSRSTSAYVEYVDGYLDRYNGSYMNVVTDKVAQSIDDVLLTGYKHVNVSRGYMLFVNVIRKDGVITSVMPNNVDKNVLLTFSDVGQNADLVLARRRLASPELTVIYRFIDK